MAGISPSIGMGLVLGPVDALDAELCNSGEWASEVVASAVGAPHVIHGFSSPKASDLAAVIKEGLAQVYEGLGVDPPGNDTPPASPYLDIWPEGLRPQTGDWLYQSMWPLRPEHALPLAAPAPRPTVLDGLPHERTVYVTAGTTHNSTPGLLETMVAALRGEAVNVVATIGPDGDLDRFASRPANVRVERYIAQSTLLPHCEAVVCNSGAGTVLGALAHGLPLLLLPVATDQYEMAAQVEQAGAGIVCHTEPLCPGAVREAFQELSSNPVYPTAAARLREQILSMPTPAELIPQLEELALRARDHAEPGRKLQSLRAAG